MSGSKGARASPDLIAACHVFHRLSVPRHPSEALMRLIVLSKTHAWGRFADEPYERAHPRPHMRFNLSLQTMMSSRIHPPNAGYAPDEPFHSQCHRTSAGGRSLPGWKLDHSTIAATLRTPQAFRRGGWWSQTESNRRHPACKAGALPAELWPQESAASSTSPPQEHSKEWWAQADSNCRPHAYQACALTN
jgi:hypothetical protein